MKNLFYFIATLAICLPLNSPLFAVEAIPGKPFEQALVLPTFEEYLNKTNETGSKNGKIIGEDIIGTITSSNYQSLLDTAVKQLCSEKGTKCGLNPWKAILPKMGAQNIIKNFISQGKYILPEMTDPAWPSGTGNKTERIFCEAYRKLYMDLLEAKKKELIEKKIIQAS